MKKDGYFVECTKCGSYDVSLDADKTTYNNLTKQIRKTWVCNSCNKTSIEVVDKVNELEKRNN